MEFCMLTYISAALFHEMKYVFVAIVSQRKYLANSNKYACNWPILNITVSTSG